MNGQHWHQLASLLSRAAWVPGRYCAATAYTAVLLPVIAASPSPSPVPVPPSSRIPTALNFGCQTVNVIIAPGEESHHPHRPDACPCSSRSLSPLPALPLLLVSHFLCSPSPPPPLPVLSGRQIDINPDQISFDVVNNRSSRVLRGANGDSNQTVYCGLPGEGGTQQ